MYNQIIIYRSMFHFLLESIILQLIFPLGCYIFKGSTKFRLFINAIFCQEPSTFGLPSVFKIFKFFYFYCTFIEGWNFFFYSYTKTRKSSFFNRAFIDIKHDFTCLQHYFRVHYNVTHYTSLCCIAIIISYTATKQLPRSVHM